MAVLISIAGMKPAPAGRRKWLNRVALPSGHVEPPDLSGRGAGTGAGQDSVFNVVREAGDLSAGVYNDHGEMLAQAVTGTPGMSMPWPMLWPISSAVSAARTCLTVISTSPMIPGKDRPQT